MTIESVPGYGPFRRSALHAAGLSGTEIRAALRSGALVRPCRGMYLPGDGPESAVRSSAEHWERVARRHTLAVRAALARLDVPAAVSHASAAVLHGLDVWDLPLDVVHLTRDRASGARRGRDLQLHVAPLAGVVVGDAGTTLTSVARTVVDVGRTAPFAQAVVVADAALRTAATTRTALRAVLDAEPGRHGNAAAARVVAFADGRAASPGESRSRALFHAAGVAPASLQHEVRGHEGRLATVDFWWDGSPPVVGEFDGEIKYGRLLRPGRTAGQEIVEEKIREDRLRDLGLHVVRWTWRDLAEPAELLRRIRHRLAR